MGQINLWLWKNGKGDVLNHACVVEYPGVDTYIDVENPWFPYGDMIYKWWLFHMYVEVSWNMGTPNHRCSHWLQAILDNLGVPLF